MESRTKVKLSRNDLQRLVNYAFGSIPLVSVWELTDGWFNTAYHLALGQDKVQTVLKVGPPAEADVLSYEKDILRAEVETMKLVATNQGIPVPHIAFDDFSRRHLPYDYYFMDFVDGTTWDRIRDDLSVEQNNAIEYQLGQITAHINSFENSSFGYYAYGREFDNWTEAFHWMCSLLFADARRYGIALKLSEQDFYAQFDKHRAIFEQVTRPRLVHWDLWAGNIFITFNADEPKISGIVDFERALWGDPLMESYLGRLRGIPHYLAGYGQDPLATRAQRLRRIFYNIYLDLIMIIEDGPRQFDDKRSVEWAQERLRRDIKMLCHGDVLFESNQKQLPLPGLLLAQTSPWCAARICLTKDSLKPPLHPGQS
jgi:aminoglycoside phosphotransferase (APT) family kinase protein